MVGPAVAGGVGGDAAEREREGRRPGPDRATDACRVPAGGRELRCQLPLRRRLGPRVPTRRAVPEGEAPRVWEALPEPAPAAEPGLASEPVRQGAVPGPHPDR